MRPDEKDPEPIDINLDSEPIAESHLGATGLVAAPEEADAAALQGLVDQLAKLQAEKDDLYQTLIRRQADFENYRKRIERDRAEDGRRATSAVLEGLLPVLDAFERALAAEGEPAFAEHRAGYELIYKQLWDALARMGLEKIEAVGQTFDPFYHQAVERVERPDLDEGTVIEDLQRGYKFRGHVLRPSMVKVATRPAQREALPPAAKQDSKAN